MIWTMVFNINLFCNETNIARISSIFGVSPVGAVFTTFTLYSSAYFGSNTLASAWACAIRSILNIPVVAEKHSFLWRKIPWICQIVGDCFEILPGRWRDRLRGRVVWDLWVNQRGWLAGACHLRCCCYGWFINIRRGHLPMNELGW